MFRVLGRLRIAALAVLLLGTPPASRGGEGAVYQVGVIPQAPPVAMFEKWGPLLERLSARSGATLRAKLYEDMGAFEADFQTGGPDFLFAHPVMATVAHRTQGYIPLVRDRRELSGWIFVRRDSPYQSIADLEGKRIAFVGDRSFCSILVRMAIAACPTATVSFDRSYAGSTRNVLRAVVLGKADAGASLDAALETEPGELRDLIRPILVSPSSPPHPLSAHPRVPAALRARITAAILAMGRSERDRALLAAIRMPDPLPADYDRDYRGLEPRP